METVHFLAKNGEMRTGYLVRKYTAFEGDVRYIVQSGTGEHRCIYQEGIYVELVV